MDVGTVILIVILVGSTIFGLNRMRTEGRVKLHLPGHYITQAELGHEFGKQATFVQFSSPYCQPCKATHAIIEKMVEPLNNVNHVDLQVADHLDMVNKLHIMRTPTTVLLDAKGHVVYRSDGVPRTPELQDALDRVISSSRPLG